MAKVELIICICTLSSPGVFALSFIDYHQQSVADTGKTSNEAEAGYDFKARHEFDQQNQRQNILSESNRTSSQKNLKKKIHPTSKRKAKRFAFGITLAISIFFILIGISLMLGWLNPLWVVIIFGVFTLFFLALALFAIANGKILPFFGWGVLTYLFFELFTVAVDLFLNGGSLLIAGGSLVALGVIGLIILAFLARNF